MVGTCRCSRNVACTMSTDDHYHNMITCNFVLFNFRVLPVLHSNIISHTILACQSECSIVLLQSAPSSQSALQLYPGGPRNFYFNDNVCKYVNDRHAVNTSSFGV